jgi:protein-glutamine gamma-glutamyltransferase
MEVIGPRSHFLNLLRYKWMGCPHSVAVRPVERFFEFSLLGLVTSGYLAVVGSGYLDTPTIILTCAGLLLRALSVAGLVRIRLSGRVVAVCTLAYVVFYVFDYSFLSNDFLAATVHLVFYVAVVQVLIAHTARDYFWVKIIALMELLAASVLSPRLNFFVCLAFFALFAVAALMSSEVRRSAQATPALSRVAGRRLSLRLAGMTLAVVLGTLAVSTVLFFVLPRTARAAFQHLVPEQFYLSGFSRHVTLGTIGRLKRMDTPVMHVKIESRMPLPPLKWRGTALVAFDGRTWSNPAGGDQILKTDALLLQLLDDHHRSRKGPRIRYDVQLKPLASDTIFFTGTPEFLLIGSRRVIRTATGAYRPIESNPDGLRYGGYSVLDNGQPVPPAELLPDAERAASLALPPLDPRIGELACRLTAGVKSPLKQAQAIETHLKTHYHYTLDLPSTSVADPLTNFLFERRQGHCEYFASAMAVMVRTLGIPSRVATGFQGGVFNSTSGWYLIRASDAHSWVEVYLPRQGWTTFDPTPPDTNPRQPSWWSALALYLDAADTFWQDWVLNYDLDRQLTLASRMEESGRSLSMSSLDRARAAVERWREAALAWLRSFGVFLAGLGAFLALAFSWGPTAARWLRACWRVRRVRQGEAEVSDATLLYRRMLQSLRRRGFEKPLWQTPAEFAAALPVSATASLVVDFTRAYEDLRFGGRRESASRLIALLEQIEKRRVEA